MVVIVLQRVQGVALAAGDGAHGGAPAVGPERGRAVWRLRAGHGRRDRD